MGQPSVVEIMSKAAETFKERNKMYAASYKTHGDIMAALFPEGLKLITSDDFTRFALLDTIVSKLHRYSITFSLGGHQDSMHDAGVYCFMLEEIDSR